MGHDWYCELCKKYHEKNQINCVTIYEPLEPVQDNWTDHLTEGGEDHDSQRRDSPRDEESFEG